MKKALAFLTVCIVTTGFAFAEFDFSFYGRGVFTPAAFSGDDSSVSAATTTWNNEDRPRIGFTVHANNAAKSIGMTGTLFLDSGTPAVGENANVWVKPLSPFGLGEALALTIGRFEIDDFRGRIGAGEFSSWITPDGSQDEDGVFTRFKSTAGAHITVKPLALLDSPWNGLAIEAAIGSSLGGERAYKNIIGWSAADVYKAVQVGLGYRLPDIGFARVQFIGNNREAYIDNYLYEHNFLQTRLSQGLSTNSDADVIEAAFLFDRIENLKVEAGAKIPLQYTTQLPNYVYYPGVYYGNYPYQTGSTNGVDNLEIQFPISAVIGTSFTWEATSATARVDMSFGGKYVHEGVRTITIGTGMGVMVSAGYRLQDALRVGLDAAFNLHIADEFEAGGKTETIGDRPNDTETSERRDFGIAPWVAVNLGGGVVKAGIAVMIPSGERWSYNSSDAGHPWRQIYSGKPVISIPISVTYNF
jgi:hypothetical protein